MKIQKQIFHHTKQMFAYDNKCFYNDFDFNIENKNDCFIIQYSFEQITGESQNATERFKSLTTNQSRLRQGDATPAWREGVTGSSKFHFKKKNDLHKKTDSKMLKQNDVNQNLQIINK